MLYTYFVLAAASLALSIIDGQENSPQPEPQRIKMSLRPARKKKYDLNRYIVSMPSSGVFAGQMVKQALNEICYGMYQLHEQRTTANDITVINDVENLTVRLEMDVVIMDEPRLLLAVCTMHDALPISAGAEESQWWPDRVMLTIKGGNTTRWRYRLRETSPEDSGSAYHQMQFDIEPDTGDEGPQPAMI